MNLKELSDLAADAGDLTGPLCAPWDGEPEDDPVQVKIQDLVKNHQDSLSRALTDDHLRVLVHLDGCRLCQPSNLIGHVHDALGRADEVVAQMVRSEFNSRVDYLESHGLISPAADGKVRISHLGKGVVRVFRLLGQLPQAKEERREKAFIGSSKEGLPIARSLQALLRDDLRCVIWDQDTVFGVGEVTIESLERAVHSYDYGIFVFTPDDKLLSRQGSKPVARDNVLFELGLFIGKLTRRRAFLVSPPEGTIALPSDLRGITAATYDASELPANLSETEEDSFAVALGPVANQIRLAVQRVRRENYIGECA